MIGEISEKLGVIGDNHKEENAEADSGHATDDDNNVEEIIKEEELENTVPYRREIVWPNVLKFIILHSLALYGFTLLPQLRKGLIDQIFILKLKQ